MPLTGDMRELRALARNLKELGTPGSPAERRFLGAVRERLKPAVQTMYSTGVGPAGAWQPRADGKPALRSRQLAGMVAIKRMPRGLLVAWRRAWMLAQDEGHTFPARRASGGGMLFFSKNGRLVSRARFERRERTAAASMRAIQGLLATGISGAQRLKLERRLRLLGRGVGFVSDVKQHTVGDRVLPSRPQKPRAGSLPPAWIEAVHQGADDGFRAFDAVATR